MKHPALTPCLILAAVLGVALPAAHAGGAITKCVDGAGRVTLTDQPCDAHTVTSAVVVPATPTDQDTLTAIALVPASAPARSAALRQARPAPAAPLQAPHAAFSGDMATMKQARVALLLQDAAPRNRLAAR